jgi:WD40 repeat protein
VWNPAGTHIAVASEGEARVYDAKTGSRIATLAGHEGAIFAIAFTPDGQRVATGGYDGIVRLFDAASGKLKSAFVPVPLSTAAQTASSK